MEETMLELVKISQEKKFLCIHDDEVKNVIEQRGSHSIQSLQNFKVVHKSSISFDTSQISSIHSIAPILSTKEPENSLSIGYEHLSITPDTKSDELMESNAENLLPIPSECEVALEDKNECDLPISENSPVCDNFDTFSDSEINDDISVYDDDFENIEYVEASLSDPEIVSVEEENVVQQEEEEIDFEDISQIQDVVLREKLLSITGLISNIKSLNDNSTPDRVFNSFESDNSLLIIFHPNSKLFAIIRKRREVDNPSIPRPPPKPPDVETNAGEEILVVMIGKDRFDDDYHFFMFDKVFSLLSTESEDTIFDPGIFD
nr:hypothetical protein [Tanacetum cinerariifolium]